MGVKLTFLSLWTPKFIINRELEKVSKITTQSLKEILRIYAPKTSIKDDVLKTVGGIEGKRDAMGKQHAILVNALVEALGEETAVKMGRETMFKVGKQLGSQNRNRLNVGNSKSDLIKAAKIMYRVLGIDFNVDWLGPEQADLVVHRCALAKNYSKVTCEVLSATDEGVVNGLNPNLTMKFDKTITSGCNACTARIERKHQP
jgi:hypothetical protein